MKVLVFGSSGAIGFPVAQALVRAGHIVYGQTRSEAKAQQLAAEEIIPVVCDIVSSDTWHSLIPTIDVVIEAVGLVGRTDFSEIASLIREAVVKAAEHLRPAGAPKLTFIYTSGMWVHGDNRKDIVTDTTPVENPVELVTWRPAEELATLANTTVNGIVVRPALVYGRSGSLFAPLFKQAKTERKVSWPGSPGGKFALIHADDLADLYVRLSEGASIAGGKIFDVSNDTTEDVDAFLKKLSVIAGLNGEYQYRTPSNPFETALGTTVLLRPYLARSLFEWQPRKIGFTDGLEVYYSAFQATL
ncbi:hypothetical protein BDP27DRAFT_1359735 [Rhodocollybia butyracea]|uniref:NAD-dependent epimerase/dehydratase domain-containing protein n=1 Tax=Rhodocollybia butyracea TaxID=206335 RepID=A0A9P5Q2D5_9AGAR|nr:hypothetical protein BDP27DRAFT_1359735 [Rhodocollybia butyracea]